jgi:hypothetical protein
VAVLGEALARAATGRDLSGDEFLRSVVGRGGDQATAEMLRALALEARNRIALGGELGQALRDLNATSAANFLEMAAQNMAAAGGFPLPDPGPVQAGGSYAPGTAPARAFQLLDALTVERVRAVSRSPVRPSEQVFDRGLPMELPAQASLSIGGLLTTLQSAGTMADLRTAPGMFMAVSVAANVLRRIPEFSGAPEIAAAQVVSVDPQPLHTAVRLYQIADAIDARRRTPLAFDAPGRANGFRGRGVSNQFRAIAQAIETTANDTAALSTARASGLFGALGARFFDADTIAIAEQAVEQPAAQQATQPPAQPAAQPAAQRPAQQAAQPPAQPVAATAVPPSATTTNSSEPALELPRSLNGPASPGPAAAVTTTADIQPYRYDPDVQAEHALLGSLLHAPDAVGEVSAFLKVSDFSRQENRAVFQTLRGLHRAGALFDIASLPDDRTRFVAANENQVKLLVALREGTYTDQVFTTDPRRILATMDAAAPLESLPYRGVYDPGIQMRLGRMVLEDSIRRKIVHIGVEMQSLPTPAVAAVAPKVADAAAESLRDNLLTIVGQTQALSRRLAEAVKRTGPQAQDGDVPDAAAIAEAATTGRRRLFDVLRPVATPLQNRAERHLLHLVLHAGHRTNLPSAVARLAPEDFADQRNANLWRTIQGLWEKGEPAFYVAVSREARESGFVHKPLPPAKVMARMIGKPEDRPERVARSLHIVAASSLARATGDGRAAITAVADKKTVPVHAALDQVVKEAGALADRASTARRRHQQAKDMHHATGRHSR